MMDVRNCMNVDKSVSRYLCGEITAQSSKTLDVSVLSKYVEKFQQKQIMRHYFSPYPHNIAHVGLEIYKITKKTLGVLLGTPTFK